MATMPNNILDWVQAYNKKAGEQFNLLPDATMWADHKHGIVSWEIKDGNFWIRHCSCDFRYWLPILNSFAKSLGFTYALTLTKRNYKAYERLTGAKYIDDVDGWHLFKWEVF